MKESFLHYLWQYQLFKKSDLSTHLNEDLIIVKSGIHNQNSGPDFLEAKLRIADQLWAGSVEIHLKSSDWYVHHHETDTAYDNVILHVVWEDDMPVFRNNNTPISTLVLKGLVPKSIWGNYQHIFNNNRTWIPCEQSIATINNFTWNTWLERLYFERLEKKSLEIITLLQKSKNDWEAVLFQLLAKNYGLKVNGEAFLEIATSINFSTLRKERSDVANLEALFFGQAGLLKETIEDKYYKTLQKNHQYQVKKYKLTSINQTVKFFRLRPANFPTIRLSQLVSLYLKKENLFTTLMQTNQLNELYQLLESNAFTYWDNHYVFGKEAKKHSKKTSNDFLDLILINTIIPLKFTYLNYIDKQDLDVILSLINQIKPEKNTIITNFYKFGINAKNAQESQAILTLYNDYCNPKKCLSCRVGLEVLKKT
jgi:hypothetical protein